MKYRKEADIAELRADFLNEEEIAHLSRFPSMLGVPVIFTVRRKADGGEFAGSEAQRLKVFEAAFREGAGKSFSYADLEGGFAVPYLESGLKDKGIKIIRSLHDINAPVKDFTFAVRRLKAFNHDIIKIASLSNSLEDTLNIFRQAPKIKDGRLILIGMGKYGFASRVLAPLLGSQIVYAFSKEKIAASNLQEQMPDPVQLKSVYRVCGINAATKIFALLGASVNTSLSPQIHNGGFVKHNLNSVYVPLSAKHAGEGIAFAKQLGIKGLSVTAPFKRDVIEYLSALDGDADEAGAVNTLLAEGDSFRGFNTDLYGFKKALLEFIGKEELKSCGVAIIGAGGAARACACALKALGVKNAAVFNRTEEKAADLAALCGFKAAKASAENVSLLKRYSDLIIQTTSAGMSGADDEDPLYFFDFSGNERIFDLIYNPEKTKLLKRAEASGCKILNGYNMLKYQAYKQFEIFTGRLYE